MRTRESEGERQGGAWRLRGVEEEAGGGQGEAGGGRGLSGARHASPLPTGRGRRQGGVEMGWAVLGQVSGRQVTSFSLSLLFIFYFCYFVLGFIKNT